MKGLNYNNKCELWSLGVIIYQLAFKEFPYSWQIEFVLLKNIEAFGHKKLKNSGDKNLDDLIRKLLIYDATKRINWEGYFNHPFFNLKQKIYEHKISFKDQEI